MTKHVKHFNPSVMVNASDCVSITTCRYQGDLTWITLTFPFLLCVIVSDCKDV